MADPARYYIDPTLNADNMVVGLHIERSPSGEWIKAADFEDYKAAQRRNASLETNTKLGIEIAEMRSTIKDLAAEKEAETKATFDAIRTITQLRDENERLTRLLLDLSNAVHIHRANANGSKCDAEINRIVAEVDTIFDIQ